MVSPRTARPHGTGTVYHDPKRNRWIGSYDAGWTTDGKRERRRVVARTERECHRKLDALVRAHKAGEAPAAGSKARTTLKVWLDQWLATRATKVRPSTYQADASVTKTWIIPTIGNVRLAQLTPRHVGKLADTIIEAGKASSTAVRAHAVLMKALKDAAREGYPVQQGTLLAQPPAMGESGRDAIPLDNARRLLDLAKTQTAGASAILALVQGVRQAERLGLTWDRVDFDTERIDVSWQLQALPYRTRYDRSSGFRVPHGFTATQLDGALHLVRPKTTAGLRVIPMLPLARDALLRWRDAAPASPHGLVFPRPDGRPALQRDDDQAWYATQDTAGVAGPGGRHYTIHEARHTTASLLMAARTPPAVIEAILGHSSYAATRGYLHVDDDLARKAMADLARLIEGSHAADSPADLTGC